METVDVTRMSSKGQVVIPGDIRTALGLGSGTKFMVYGEGDTVILRRLDRPTAAELKRLLAAGSRFARQTGLKQNEVGKAIRAVRGR